MKRGAILLASLLLAACGGDSSPAENADGTSTDAAAVAITGEQVYQRCAACHKVEKRPPHGIGPNLNGIAGQKIAAAEGFSYSPALQAKSGVWDDANLNAMIEDPRAFAPGNRMSFAGIKDAGERQAVIDYLKAQK